MRMHVIVATAAVLVSALATVMVNEVKDIDWPAPHSTVNSAQGGATDIDWP